MNAQKWYGYSNARPTVGTDPMHGFAGPRWIGNGGHPSSLVCCLARPDVWRRDQL